MTCIYTGAYLLVLPYNYTIPADLYKINGSTIIARTNLEHCQSHDPEERKKATHIIDCTFESTSFHRPDIGIIVTNRDRIRTTINADERDEEI